jgi:hypothetical protein
MSEDENFLERWSRRKQQVATEARLEEKAAPEQERPPMPVPGASTETPAVDLSKLPSLDEITAKTDISGFLQKGVPTDLARAALRRAWTSDPAIRDFVGLQENDWVFNKPGPDQGFGPLGPETDVGKLLAQVFGDGPKEEPTAAVNAGAPASSQDFERGPEVASVGNDPRGAPADRNDAPHNKATGGEPSRSHGGALPRPVSES